MLRKLLYLYNDGYNPFPNMKGKGGLGYHLPQYRKIIHGDGVYERENKLSNGDIEIQYVDDENPMNVWFYDINGGETLLYDVNNNRIDINELRGKDIVVDRYYDPLNDYGRIKSHNVFYDEDYYPQAEDYDPEHDPTYTKKDYIRDIDDYEMYDKLEQLKDKELGDLLKSYDVKGYYKLNKEEKITAILSADDKYKIEINKKLRNDYPLLKAQSKQREKTQLKNQAVYDKEEEDYEKQERQNELENNFKKQVQLGDQLIELIETALTRIYIERYVTGYSDLDSAAKRAATILIYKKYLLDENQIKELQNIRKLSFDDRNARFKEWINKQNIIVNPESKIEKSEKEPEFEIPDVEYKTITPELIESVRLTELVSPTEEYDGTTQAINYMIQQKEIYKTMFNDRLLQPSEFPEFKQAFSILHSVTDLIVVIDGKEYKGTGGLDFEYKIEDNKELFEEIVRQNLGNKAKYIGAVPDPTGYTKSDFVIEAKVDNKTVYIDLELKKYMSEKGKKGQDLKAFEKVKGFDSIEEINNNTSLYFDKWFIEYKEKLNEAYEDYEDTKGTEEGKIFEKIYTDMLDKITTNNTIDKEKLLYQHVLSGKYFGVPLTVTKFQTPPKEVIQETIIEKYKDENLSKKVSKYMHHGARKNKSNNMLVPLLLVNNGMITMNVQKVFGNDIPFVVLNMIKNIYDKNIKDALGLPACFMSTVNITKSIYDFSSKITPEQIKPKIIEGLTKKMEAKAHRAIEEAKEKELKRIEKESKTKRKK